MMKTQYTIGKVAAAAGVAVSTLRYYEREGLLTPSHRTSSNYRIYVEADIERLRFIKAAQATGFTLEDIRVLLGLETGETAVCDEVRELLEKRLREVTARMKDLRRVQKMLRASHELCCSGDENERCRVVQQLTGHAPEREHEKGA